MPAAAEARDAEKRERRLGVKIPRSRGALDDRCLQESSRNIGRDQVAAPPSDGTATDPSQFDLLRNAERVIHLDSEIADRAL